MPCSSYVENHLLWREGLLRIVIPTDRPILLYSCKYRVTLYATDHDCTLKCQDW